MAKQMMDIGLKDVAGGVDLMVVNGDFVIVESTARHQKELTLNTKNDFKGSPTICVNAFSYVDDDRPGDLAQAISESFAGDGMDVKSVTVDRQWDVDTDAFYV